MAGTILLFSSEAAIASTLRGAGHHVVTVSTLDAAAQRLRDTRPDVVLMEVHVARFEGILLLRQPHALPHVETILMTRCPDAFIRAEAARHHATYLVTPDGPHALLAVVAERLEAARYRRRWTRWPVRGQLATKVGGHAAAVLDVSYEGLRFEVPPAASAELSHAVTLHLEDRQIAQSVQPVWAHHTPAGDIQCGAKCVWTDASQPAGWRQAVDSVACPA
jgi:DNA-binding response OmpR family regulator